MTDTTTATDMPRPKLRKGFARLTPERRREIAAKGGASVPAHKRSFSKDRTLAANAGSKGGTISRSPRRG